jgi:hypothetical protein
MQPAVPEAYQQGGVGKGHSSGPTKSKRRVGNLGVFRFK